MRCVVTGASRGIGLELTRRLLERGDVVDAGARDPARSDGLRALAARHGDRLRAHALDVSNDASVAAFAERLPPGDVHVLWNCAGVGSTRGGLDDFDAADALRIYDVNAVGPIRVVRALRDRFAKGAKLAQVTSRMGSIADNQMGGMIAYRMSKAALNQANKCMSLALAESGVTCVAIHPGWVKTEMGGPNAPLDAETSAGNMIGVVDRVTIEHTGSFLDHTGATIPW